MSVETVDIELEMMEKIEKIRKSVGNNNSSHAFASLFIWKKEMELSILLEDDFFAVKYGLKGENSWFFPCGNIEEIMKFIECFSKKSNFKIYFISNDDKKIIENNFPNKFNILPEKGDFEYLYDIKEQVNLVGRKFTKLKNDLNKLHHNHTVRYEIISDDNIDIVRKICEESSTHEEFNHDGISNTNSKMVIVENYKELKAHGVLVYMDDIPFSASIGYALDDDIFDFSLTVQLDRVSGMMIYSRTALMETIQNDYEILNAEEDLDLEGIRLMKNKMRPIGFVEMFGAEYIE